MLDGFAVFLWLCVLQPDQELSVPLGSQQGTLDQPADVKPLCLCKPQYIQQHLFMDLRVADHPISARNILFPRFELRFN